MLEDHLKVLSMQFPLWVDDNSLFVIVGKLKLPPGYNHTLTQLLIELPDDYPLSPPGIGDCLVYVDPNLRFGMRELRDVHPSHRPTYQTPGFGPWAWWCYEMINWNPNRDNLTTFVAMVRADLTNPPTKQELSQ